MTDQLSLSLREAIFTRMAKSDGCYVMIYSGSGERLTFISSLLGRQEDDSTFRLLLDFNLGKYMGMLNRRGLILIDSLSKKLADDSPASFSLKAIRQNLRDFADRRSKSSRIIVVAECSSFLYDVQYPLTDGVIAFHKDFLNLINSINGAAGVLLYDIDSLTEKLVPALLQLHTTSKETTEKLSLRVLKQELQERLDNSAATAEIVVRDEGLLFTDPATNSAALLLPVSDVVRELLPHDPLNVADRDIAFANNYTAGEGACPYLAYDVQSQCVLDPNVVKVGETKGRPFVMGRPCVTAIDHMIIEAESVKQENSRQCAEAEGAEDANPSKTRKYRYGTDTYSAHTGGSKTIRR